MSAAEKLNQIVKEEIHKLEPEEKKLLLVWSQEAQKIRENSELSNREKLIHLRKLKNSEVILLILKKVGVILKKNLWDDRQWTGRMALAGLFTGVAVAGAQGAGIVAFGGGIGVPVFMLTSAGGALLGTVIQELQGKKSK